MEQADAQFNFVLAQVSAYFIFYYMEGWSKEKRKNLIGSLSSWNPAVWMGILDWDWHFF